LGHKRPRKHHPFGPFLLTPAAESKKTRQSFERLRSPDWTGFDHSGQKLTAEEDAIAPIPITSVIRRKGAKATQSEFRLLDRDRSATPPLGDRV
jgi:hypothetical protein